MALVKAQTGPQILGDYAVSDVTNKIYFSAFCGISFTRVLKSRGLSHQAAPQENLIMTCNDKFALWNYLLPVWSSILLGDNSACARPAINTKELVHRAPEWRGSGGGGDKRRRSSWEMAVRTAKLPLFLFLHCFLFFFYVVWKKLMKMQQ